METKKLLLTLICIWLFGYCNCQTYSSTSCSVAGFNLLPLQYDPSGPAPAGYTYANSVTADLISINFCAQVAPQTGCSSTTSTNPPVQYPGACQSFAGNPPPGPPSVIGDATTAELVAISHPITAEGYTFTEGVVLTYTGGSFCQKFNSYRATNIAVVCPPIGFPQSQTEQIFTTNEPGNCIYEVLFVSKYGCAYTVAPSCSYGVWDLLPLQYNPNYSPAPTGYSYYNSHNGDTIAINFCAATTGCSDTADFYEAGSCRTVAGNSQVIGNVTKALFSPLLEPIIVNGVNFTEGVILTYYGGASCPSANIPTATEIVVVCPPAGYSGVREQIFATFDNNCAYEVVFVSQYGCNSQYYASSTCSFGDWNLLPLQYDPSGAPSHGYSYFNPLIGDTIYINFCAQVAPITGCNSTTDPAVNAPGSCQRIAGLAPEVSGDATKALFAPFYGPLSVQGWTFTQGVTLTYFGGTFCENFNTNRTTEIVVVCPPSGYTGPQEQIISSSESNCFYRVVFVSQYGCPSQPHK